MNSRTPSSQPGRRTRASSARARSRSATLRSPNETVAAWKLASGKGRWRASALRTDGSGSPFRPAPLGPPVAPWPTGCGPELGRRERQHRQAEVGGDDLDPRPAQGQSLVAGAAAEVEDPRTRGEDEGLGELAAPDPVERGRQQVVQEVVPPGDPAEHRPDAGGVLLLQLLDWGNVCEDFRPVLRHDVPGSLSWGRAALEARRLRVRLFGRRLDSFKGRSL